MDSESRRAEEILARLAERDVGNGHYPSGVVGLEDRRRWNQAVLVSLAAYHTYVPSMLPGEYRQERFSLALSIYRQDRDELPTGTEEELLDEIGDALGRGWL